MIPSLSWKNIWRNKVRSLVVIGSMTFGIFGGLLTWAIYKGMTDSRVKEALTKEVSHIQIHDSRFIENPEIGLTLPDPDEIVRFAEGLPGVQAASARLKVVTMINSPAASSGVTVYGIDPAREEKVSELYTSVFDSLTLARQLHLADPALVSQYLRDSTGTWFSGPQRNPIVIGETLARKLKLKIHSKVVLTFQSADGNLTGGSFRVCGIYRVDNTVFEEMNVYVRMPDLAALAALPPGTAHEVAIFLKDPKLLQKTLDLLKGRFPGLDVMSWKTLLPDVAMLNDLVEVSLVIIMIIILAALGFGIVNTMLMVVLERVKELGMLMAIGMNKKRVFYMIILESVLLCLTGAAAGMVVGAAAIAVFGHQGIDLSAFAKKGMEAWGFNAVIFPALTWPYYILVAVLVVITGIAASAYPAWKALKLNPADALRTE
jgi:ABC-type lipoprotein release transport system permease subunit